MCNGSARLRCGRCGFETLVAFSCKGKLCPSSRERGIVDGQTEAVTFVQRFGGALNLNPHFHAVVPDGLFVAERVAPETIPEGGCSGVVGMSGTRLHVVAFRPPTTADVAVLTMALAQRLTNQLAAEAEERSEHLDPDLATLCEVFFFSRNAPVSRGANTTLEGMEEAGEGTAVSGKPLCSSVAGF